MNATYRTLAEQRDALARGDVSSRELVERSLAAVEAGAEYNALVATRTDQALGAAAAADQRRASGEVLSALDGIPIVIKDNMVEAGQGTTCASRILESFVSPYDSTVVERLRARGSRGRQKCHALEHFVALL